MEINFFLDNQQVDFENLLSEARAIPFDEASIAEYEAALKSLLEEDEKGDDDGTNKADVESGKVQEDEVQSEKEFQ